MIRSLQLKTKLDEKKLEKYATFNFILQLNMFRVELLVMTMSKNLDEKIDLPSLIEVDETINVLPDPPQLAQNEITPRKILMKYFPFNSIGDDNDLPRDDSKMNRIPKIRLNHEEHESHQNSDEKLDPKAFLDSITKIIINNASSRDEIGDENDFDDCLYYIIMHF